MLKLKTLNNALLVGIILINSYLIVVPFYPKLYLWWQIRIEHRQHKLETFVKEAKKPSSGKTSFKVPQGEWLVIPKIALNTPIFEGPTVATANRGAWHLPNSAVPGSSNTIIAGHRFTYTQPKGIFYNLDKLAAGDKITVFWNGKAYFYTVSDSKVVSPADVSVEQSSGTEKLTLYTCTPLWSAKNRLIVIAVRSEK